MATYYQTGSKGNEVKQLQEQLKAAGFDPGGADGIYGNNTAAAVRAYQKAKGLTVDGIAGVQTLGSLNKPAAPVTPPAPRPPAPAPVTPAAPAAPAKSTASYNPQTGTGTFDDGTKYEKFTYENGVPTNAGTGAVLPPLTSQHTQTAQPAQNTSTIPEYQSPLTAEMQQAFADYQQWASQPYVSEYAPEIESLVKDILSRQFNYDPKDDAQFQLASKELTRNVMETMNARGILNSTVTENQVQQGVSDLLPQYQQIAQQSFMDEGNQLMSQVDMLMGVDETQYGRYQDEGKRYADVLGVVMDMDDNQYTKWKDAYTNRYNVQRDKITDEQTKAEADGQKVKDAWERTSELGYVDNNSSITLGVPAGTLSKEAREAKQEAEQRLVEQKQSLSNQLTTINAQYEKEKKVSALKGDSKGSPETLGTKAQVDSYHQLRDIYFGGGNGKYTGKPLDAYNWLMSHSKDNIGLIGQNLYNKLLAELTDSMKTQKSYGDTTSIPAEIKPYYDRAVAMMKEKNVDGDDYRYTTDDIFSYIDMQNLTPEQKDDLADKLGLPK